VTNDRVEPAAELRQAAHTIRETYIALTNEGFTETQALHIVGQLLVAALGK
jgi:hypothetical protein